MYGIDELSDLLRRSPIALYRTGPSGALLAANTALANLLDTTTWKVSDVGSMT